MSRRRLTAGLSMLLVVAAIPAPAGAKGKVSKITLCGPDWLSEIEVRSEKALSALSLGVLEDTQTELHEIGPLGRGLLVTRYLPAPGPEGELVDRPFDRLIYFVDPAGGRGMIYYLGIVNGSGPYDGNWYIASLEGDRAIKEILELHNISPSKAPSVGQETTNSSPILGFGLTLILGLAGGWLIGNRERSTRKRSPAAGVS